MSIKIKSFVDKVIDLSEQFYSLQLEEKDEFVEELVDRLIDHESEADDLVISMTEFSQKTQEALDR